jgi:Protein of unknown function (DUF3105)
VFRRLAAVLFASTLALTAVACSSSVGSSADDVPSEESAGGATSGGVDIGPAPEGIEGVEAFRVDSHNHTEQNLDYDHKPPTGGDHFPVPATCGFYSSDPPPDELLVHDLEHGSIWIAYRPDLDATQQDALRQLVAEQAKVTATPYPDLDSPLVMTAWGRQLKLDSADDPRVQQFIDTYRNSANAPEPGAACQGIGTPEVAAPTA